MPQQQNPDPNNNFDFSDLMAFGMFILTLLSFIYLICQ